MKHNRLIILGLWCYQWLCLPLCAQSYDFYHIVSVSGSSGNTVDTLFCRQLGADSASVVAFRRQGGWGQLGIADTVFIPSQVKHNVTEDTYRVTAVGDSVFMGMNAMTHISLPVTLNKIGTAAFANCSALKNVTLHDVITFIGEQAFMNCRTMDSLLLPANLKTVKSKAFSGCTGLKYLSLGTGIKSVGDNAFNGCIGLTFVQIPPQVTLISAYAFAYCYNIKQIVLGDNITEISTWAFGWSNITNRLYLPGKIKTIRSNAFLADKIPAVYCPTDVLPTFENNAFRNAVIDTLYVPDESVDAYRNASFALMFSHIVGMNYGRSEVQDLTPTTVSIKWLPNENPVAEYCISVYKSDDLFAEYRVDGQGRWISGIRYDTMQQNAPMRVAPMHIKMDTTVSTTEYFVLTMEDLNNSTEYSYTIAGTSTIGDCVYYDRGTFVTQRDPDDIGNNVKDISADNLVPCPQKFYRDGQLLIRYGNGLYNLIGVPLR